MSTTFAVSHIGICVSDIKRSRKFYEALGFEFIREFRNTSHEIQDRFLRLPPGVDLHAYYMQNGGLQIELLAYYSPYTKWQERPMNQPGFTHLSLKVANVEAALKDIEAAGGRILKETHIGPNACFARDPDGQLIELVIDRGGKPPPAAH